MKLLDRLFKSTLGKKMVMAVTGVALFGFVIGHLLGNLQVFLGDNGEAINKYGYFLHSTPELLWGARIGLLVMVFLHIWAAVKLTAENRAARPIAYAGNPTPVVATYASRTMFMSGLIIAAFVIYHLLHFTVWVSSINFTGQDFHEMKTTLNDGTRTHDVYRMMIVGFSNIGVSIFYMIAMGLLCLHLSHGVAAMFSSLGLKTKEWASTIDRFARTFAILIFVGYVSIPLAVLIGVVK
jgi:succinate dehydrogenase / fumarate reductase, cytochrome b subunit